MTTQQDRADTVKRAVQDRYGRIAEDMIVQSGPDAGLIDGPGYAGEVIPLQPASTCCGPGAGSEIQPANAQLLYAAEELAGLPDSVTGISLGCGNPTAIARLQPGQTVLDLGSGGGIDCFLAARQVGSTGRVLGLDMTQTMIELAERNKARLGTAAANVTFLYGEMEAIPLPDNEVDVIISNCVINLSPDKDTVLREAYRVLRGSQPSEEPSPSTDEGFDHEPLARRRSGYLAVSDIVLLQPLPEPLAGDLAAWADCVAGALPLDTFLRKLEAAGFKDIEVIDLVPTDFGTSSGGHYPSVPDLSEAMPGGLKSLIASARILAYK